MYSVQITCKSGGENHETTPELSNLGRRARTVWFRACRALKSQPTTHTHTHAHTHTLTHTHKHAHTHTQKHKSDKAEMKSQPKQNSKKHTNKPKPDLYTHKNHKPHTPNPKTRDYPNLPQDLSCSQSSVSSRNRHHQEQHLLGFRV